mmetsp:Transcript_30756/g.73889  ORF Transcript_30756/g.73889 Transcript_30756/m.73889 type:complete len:571 (+) Transcript_30756:69-1781(+)
MFPPNQPFGQPLQQQMYPPVNQYPGMGAQPFGLPGQPLGQQYGYGQPAQQQFPTQTPAVDQQAHNEKSNGAAPAQNGAHDGAQNGAQNATQNGTAEDNLRSVEPAKVGEVPVEVSPPKEFAVVGFAEIFKEFVVLGWTAFGGPAAHIALFRKVFIDKLNWFSDSLFMEIFALGQCLPGPTSTQVSFAIGVVKKGIPGGLLSGMLFQYPGLVVMSAIGFGAQKADWDKDILKGFGSGLAAVGVALVAGAAYALSKKTCPDLLTGFLNLLAAVVAYLYSTAWIFPVLIVFGGLCTYARDVYEKRPVKAADGNEGIESLGVNKVVGGFLLFVWLAVLVVVIVLRQETDYHGSNKALHWFEAFYRTGSIIFGGGQVVLPLIIEEVVQYQEQCTPVDGGGQRCIQVPDYEFYPLGFDDSRTESWMTETQFFTGLAISQAMPGPLFNLSAYLGALIASKAGWNAITGVVCCWVGLFGPGILVIYGALPFWGSFRQWPLYRRALPGMNAAAVGLVVAAVFSLYDKARSTSPFPDWAVAIGILGFVAVEVFKMPAPAAVVGGGFLGLVGYWLKIKWIL